MTCLLRATPKLFEREGLSEFDICVFNRARHALGEIQILFEVGFHVGAFGCSWRRLEAGLDHHGLSIVQPRRNWSALITGFPEVRLN